LTVNLGIDCSTKWVSLGLSENGSITSEMHLNAGRKQASCLPAALQAILSLSGFSLSRITRVVLATGPGSFTGVRLGLSYGLALAAALDCPVVPVNNLETTALQVSDYVPNRVLSPLLWAKRDYVYSALYRKNHESNSLSILRDPGFFSQAVWLETLRQEIDNPLLIIEAGKRYDLFSDYSSIFSSETPSGGRLSLLGDLFSDRETSFENIKGTYLRNADIG
jgi:tRNA threonylcarbamoyladenosine biosynthesis protein TsaB